MDRTNLADPKTVLENLRNNIVYKNRTEVYVRNERKMQEKAENLMNELIKAGIIKKYWIAWECGGTLCYRIEY